MKAQWDIKYTPDVGHLELKRVQNKHDYDANDQKRHNRTNTNTQQLKSKTLKMRNTKDTRDQIRAHLGLNGSGCNCVHVCCRLNLQLLLQIYWCKICTIFVSRVSQRNDFQIVSAGNFLEPRCKRSIASSWRPSQLDESVSRTYFLVIFY